MVLGFPGNLRNLLLGGPGDGLAAGRRVGGNALGLVNGLRRGRLLGLAARELVLVNHVVLVNHFVLVEHGI